MKDVMIDLESMGVGTSPALLQISAVAFDINTGETGAVFDRKIDLQSSMDIGLQLSAGTIKFWMTNSTVTQEAREIVMEQTGDHGKLGDHINVVLIDFSRWCVENDVKYIHGNGSASDNVWLRSAYTAAQLPAPFTFRDDICFRTIRTIAKRSGFVDNIQRSGVYHNGVDDCKHQIKQWIGIKECLNLPNLD